MNISSDPGEVKLFRLGNWEVILSRLLVNLRSGVVVVVVVALMSVVDVAKGDVKTGVVARSRVVEVMLDVMLGSGLLTLVKALLCPGAACK